MNHTIQDTQPIDQDNVDYELFVLRGFCRLDSEINIVDDTWTDLRINGIASWIDTTLYFDLEQI